MIEGYPCKGKGNSAEKSKHMGICASRASYDVERWSTDNLVDLFES